MNWILKLLAKGVIFGAIALVLLSVDWKQVSTRADQSLSSLDQQYRGVRKLATQAVDTTKSIAGFLGWATDSTKRVFSLDLSDPLTTGHTFRGYNVLVSDPDRPEIPSILTYPETIAWTAPADGDLVSQGDRAAYSSPALPGYRFLFQGIDPTGNGPVKKGDLMIVAPGEIQISLQQNTPEGWIYVPMSRNALYTLILGGHQ
jgi:hypothetical protein